VSTTKRILKNDLQMKRENWRVEFLCLYKSTGR